MKLVTHSGTFHADDVMAYAILSRVYPEAELVRTRDQAILEGISGDDIEFDVGAVYSHRARRYDHHMLDGPKRDDGSPYSSVGLIWKHYGLACLAAMAVSDDEEALARIWHSVDESLVREIDLLDNGIGVPSGSSFPSFVDDFNPAWDDARANPDAAFREAAELAGKTLERRIRKAAAAERAFSATVESAQAAEDPRIVVLPGAMPWERGIFERGFHEALYVVYPRPHGGGWFCSAVPPEPGSFAQRKPLPASWAGLRDEQLAKETGVKDAVFCHPARFVCGATSKEGVMSMANAAANAPEAEPSARPR